MVARTFSGGWHVRFWKEYPFHPLIHLEHVPTGRLFGHLVVLLFGSIKLLVLNTNERAVGTMTDEWLLYQLCHVGQIWSSGKLIPCIYPPPGNIAKWRLLGIPYSKCTDPGGDWLSVGGGVDPTHSFFFGSYLLFSHAKQHEATLGPTLRSKGLLPSKSYGAIPALRILVNRERMACESPVRDSSDTNGEKERMSGAICCCAMASIQDIAVAMSPAWHFAPITTL